MKSSARTSTFKPSDVLAWGREGKIPRRTWSGWRMECARERGFYFLHPAPVTLLQVRFPNHNFWYFISQLGNLTTLKAFYQVCGFVIVCVVTQFRGDEQRTGGGGGSADNKSQTQHNLLQQMSSCILYNLLLQYGLLKFYCNIAKLLQFKQNTVAEVHIYVNVNPTCPHSYWSGPCSKEVSGLN